MRLSGGQGLHPVITGVSSTGSAPRTELCSSSGLDKQFEWVLLIRAKLRIKTPSPAIAGLDRKDIPLLTVRSFMCGKGT